jgi:hypothetical protein
MLTAQLLMERGPVLPAKKGGHHTATGRFCAQYGICHARPMLLPGSFSGVTPCAVAVPLPRRVTSLRYWFRSTLTCIWL